METSAPAIGDDHREHAPGARRDELLACLQQAGEAAPDALAMWEGGSAAFGRADHLSDVDVQALVRRGASDDVFDRVERALGQAFGIEQAWRLPEPAWHGHSQRFYRLRGLGPYLLVDLCLMQEGAADLFDQRERHGALRVLFDRGTHLAPRPIDCDAWRERLRGAVDQLVPRYRMISGFVEKEAARGNLVEATDLYRQEVLRPLVTVLGMHHRPFRYDFGSRYLRHDFPEPIAAELVELHVVRDFDDLVCKHARAREWFEQVLSELDIDALPLEALSAAAHDTP